jgi:uncharacterized membrane protein
MEVESLLGLIFRWLHILAAITAVGGAVFARFVVVPTLEPLPPAERASLHAAMRARWSKIVAAAIAFLLISGLYNFTMTVVAFKLPPWYHMVFGVKFLAAFAVFAIASLLAGKTKAAEILRQRLKFWLNVNIAMAVLVVALSGVLRMAERIPKRATMSPPDVSRTEPDAKTVVL